MVGNFNEILKERCSGKARELYGELFPKMARERLEAELEAALRNGYATRYVVASDMVRGAWENGRYRATARGLSSSTFISFLLGLTEMNPLPPHYRCEKCRYFEWVENTDGAEWSLTQKKCPVCGEMMTGDGIDVLPEICLGLHMEKSPEISLNFAPEARPMVIRTLQEKYGEECVVGAGTIVKDEEGNVLGHGKHPGGVFIFPEGMDVETVTETMDSGTGGFSLKYTKEDYHTVQERFPKYDILSNEELGILHDLEESTGESADLIPVAGCENEDKIIGAIGKLFMKGEQEKTAFAVLKPIDFSDIIKVLGVSEISFDAEAYEIFSERLIGDAKERKIFFRDDVVRLLINAGISRDVSYGVMKRIISRKGIDPETKELMIEYGVSEETVDLFGKIKYLYPMSMMAGYALTMWRVAWYYVNCPKEYGEVMEKRKNF